MARTRYKIIDNNTPYFLTATVVNWIPLLSTRYVQQILIDSLCFLQEEGRLCLYAYVILENHLHLVASSSDLSKEIGNFKSYTDRQIIDYYRQQNAHNILKQLTFHKKLYKQDREHQFWQEGSHPQRIYDLGPGSLSTDCPLQIQAEPAFSNSHSKRDIQLRRRHSLMPVLPRGALENAPSANRLCMWVLPPLFSNAAFTRASPALENAYSPTIATVTMRHLNHARS